MVALSPVGTDGGVVSGTPGVVAVTMFEYGPRLPAASTARTRNRYAVLGFRSGLLNVVEPLVPIWAKLVQPAFWQRSTRYSVTPTLSVAAVQLRST